MMAYTEVNMEGFLEAGLSTYGSGEVPEWAEVELPFQMVKLPKQSSVKRNTMQRERLITRIVNSRNREAGQKREGVSVE